MFNHQMISLQHDSRNHKKEKVLLTINAATQDITSSEHLASIIHPSSSYQLIPGSP